MYSVGAKLICIDPGQPHDAVAHFLQQRRIYTVKKTIADNAVTVEELPNLIFRLERFQELILSDEKI